MGTYSCKIERTAGSANDLFLRQMVSGIQPLQPYRITGRFMGDTTITDGLSIILTVSGMRYQADTGHFWRTPGDSVPPTALRSPIASWQTFEVLFFGAPGVTAATSYTFNFHHNGAVGRSVFLDELKVTGPGFDDWPLVTASPVGVFRLEDNAQHWVDAPPHRVHIPAFTAVSV